MRRIFCQAFCAALLSLQAATVWGQEVYTLEQCREMALRNNIAVRTADNEVEAARLQRQESFTKYFPNLSASGAAFAANKGLLEMDLGEGPAASLMKNGVMGGITLTQPVFAGGQLVGGNRLAAVGAEAAGIRREQTGNEVRRTVEQYYWQLVMLRGKLGTLQALERQLESLQRDVQASVDAGVALRNDLLQVQLQRNDVISSRSRLQSDLGVCRLLLAQYMGLRCDSFEVADAVTADSLPPFPQHLRCDHATALLHTPDYRLLKTNVRANRLQQKLTTGKYLPTVAVGAGYMYDNLMDKSHPFALGFVQVSIPISDWWGGSRAIRRSKVQVVNAESQLADNAELLVISMEKAWADVQDAYRQFCLAHQSIESAAENLRLYQDYYRAGTGTMSDLLDAQTLYRQSRDKYTEAYADFRLKQLEYLLATGR